MYGYQLLGEAGKKMGTTVAIREQQLNVRLNPEELELLEKLAVHFGGVTPAGAVRRLIHDSARDLGFALPVVPQKKSKR